MFQKMMMKEQRGRRPSKPKGKGPLWYLRRNAKTRKVKINKTTRRKRNKRKEKKFQKVPKKVSFYLHTFKINKSDMLITFFATPKYWKYFYCALESSKVIEKFIIEKIDQGTNKIPQIPDKLSEKSSAFFQSFIQNCNGYKGQRFICTADETHMRSSITLVISREMFGLIYDGEEEFEGSYEYD